MVQDTHDMFVPDGWLADVGQVYRTTDLCGGR